MLDKLSRMVPKKYPGMRSIFEHAAERQAELLSQGKSLFGGKSAAASAKWRRAPRPTFEEITDGANLADILLYLGGPAALGAGGVYAALRNRKQGGEE